MGEIVCKKAAEFSAGVVVRFVKGFLPELTVDFKGRVLSFEMLNLLLESTEG